MKRETTMTISILATACLLVTAPAVAAERMIDPASVESEATDDPRREWRERVEAARAQYEAFAARVAATEGRPAEDAAHASSSLASHLDDATLRAGDVVVTREGLLMFKGSETFPYDSHDFERIGEGRALSLPHRSALLEIMRAGLRRDP